MNTPEKQTMTQNTQTAKKKFFFHLVITEDFKKRGKEEIKTKLENKYQNGSKRLHLALKYRWVKFS